MDEEKKDDLATFSSKFEGKQPKWVWNLFAYIQLANDIKGGKMPAEDASKNTIEYVPADFNTYMMILHALMFHNEHLMSKRSLQRIHETHKEEVNRFLKGNSIISSSPWKKS